MNTAISNIQSIDKSTFKDDDSARLHALSEARALVQRLEHPWETVDNIVWTEPIRLTCMKTAADMDLFTHLSSTPRTSVQLADAMEVKPDATLVSRVARMLAAASIIAEVDVDTYASTELSEALKDRAGLVSGIHHFYDIGVSQLARLPDYFHETNYRNPTSREHPPWEYIMPGSEPDMWKWYQTYPHAHANFHSFLSSIRVGQPPWPTYYPLSRLLSNADFSKPFVVDVGGGKGRDLTHLSSALLSSSTSDLQPQLILQDLPPVISAAEREHLPADIRLMAHDFFSAQPVKGAKAYFMHSICHDWPDTHARRILMRLKEAMTEGYSKLLLLEAVMPERVKGMRPRMAAMDINMYVP